MLPGPSFAALDARDKKKNARMLQDRFFQGTVSAVDLTGVPLQVQVTRVGETESDGNWYPVGTPGWTPGVGDTIDLMWRDQHTAYAMTPINPVNTPSRMIDAQIADGTRGDLVFPNIPASFRHLEILAKLKTDQASSQVVYMQFNGDTSGNYVYSVDQITATASSATQTPTGSTSQGRIATAAVYKASNRITIFDYASAASIDGFKHSTNLAVRSEPAGTSSETFAMEWRPATAQIITNIRLVAGAGKLAVGSSAVLYGI